MISTCGDAEPYGDPVNIIVPITMTITFVIVCSSAIMARIVSEFVQVFGSSISLPPETKLGEVMFSQASVCPWGGVGR